MIKMTQTKELSLQFWQQILFVVLSFLIVSIGEPARCAWCGVLSAFCGYAIFWRVLLPIKETKARFWIGSAWGAAVHAVHISWFIDHPFLYIYIVWFFFAAACGLQFGLISLMIVPKKVVNLAYLLVVASVWTVMEWLRLFFMTGYSWNPVGLALTGNLYALQFASVSGVFGLTFLTIFVNLLLLRAWILKVSVQKKVLAFASWLLVGILPFAYGYYQLTVHEKAFVEHQIKNPEPFSVVLVQTAFEPEEPIPFADLKSAVAYVMNEWRLILNILHKQEGKKIDLIAFPEYTVPYGTYSPVFPLEMAKDIFRSIYGEKSLELLPPLEDPWASSLKTQSGELWVVNNAFMSQAIANIFNAEVLIGLEDADKVNGKMQIYSAAICFYPHAKKEEERYEKRVLVPMAEYIPFSFVKALAATYGISGSFTPGMGAKVFQNAKANFGCCICYEETFGHLMRESRMMGANLLVNVTNDAWYPNSLLPQQHFDHARLRTVENGVPLVRACNTGITCAIDSLGRVVSALGDGDPKAEWLADTIHIDVPTYTYSTLYSRWGDTPIISFTLLLSIGWFISCLKFR